MQRLIVEALATQPTELGSGNGLRRLLQSPVSLLVFGSVVLASEVLGVVVGLILRQRLDLTPDTVGAVAMLPIFWLVFGLQVFFPRRYLAESTSALVQTAVRGDNRLAPAVKRQPEPLEYGDCPTAGTMLGPVFPLRSPGVEHWLQSDANLLGLYGYVVGSFGGLCILA
jgi:hypothetical protein